MKNQDNQPIIEFKNVTKSFSLQSHKTFKEFLPALILGEQTSKQFTALNNINFSINSGETVGIIGPNGSGKSTILKIIAGVMNPTDGSVTVKGRVSPLIELGAGFHFELSGRENIFLNGAILGLSQKEITDNFKNIVDFADIWEYIDQPAKRYSSGMYMRLAFSIAVHVHPQILLVDEILAVGDPEFQTKCFAKMNQFKKDGVTILFVSHDLDVVQKFCDRVIFLDHSQVSCDSTPAKVIQLYQLKYSHVG